MHVFPESKLWKMYIQWLGSIPICSTPSSSCATLTTCIFVCVSFRCFLLQLKTNSYTVMDTPTHTSPLPLPNPCHILIQILIFYFYCSALYFSTNISWKSLHAFPDLLPLLPSPSPFFFHSCILFLPVDAPES